MQHVLVTGGAGYVGSTLVPLLLRSGLRVTVLERFYFGAELLLDACPAEREALRLVRGDVRTVSEELFEDVDAVVDLAGISNDPACELDGELTRAINREGALRVASLAHYAGVPRLVFASSCSVYGSGHDRVLDEDSPTEPVSLYARCKLEAERELLRLGVESDLCVTSLRLATIFGLSGRMRFDLAVNLMTRNAYLDQRIVVQGGGRQWRPFVHVRDVARAVLNVLSQPPAKVRGRVFNVGSSEQNYQMQVLARRVRDRIPGTEIDVVPSDPDRRSYRVRFDRIRDELDFKTETSVEEGVDEIREALASGRLDPADRRWHTLQHYRFLAEVERLYRELALEGRVLAAPASGAAGSGEAT